MTTIVSHIIRPVSEFTPRARMSCAYSVKVFHLFFCSVLPAVIKNICVCTERKLRYFFIFNFFSDLFFSIRRLVAAWLRLRIYFIYIYISVRWRSRLNWHFDMTAPESNWTLRGLWVLKLKSYFGQKMTCGIKKKLNEMKTGKADKLAWKKR